MYKRAGIALVKEEYKLHLISWSSIIYAIMPYAR